MIEDITTLKYIEALQLPKFKKSLDRLLNLKAYDTILSAHSIDEENLARFVSSGMV